MKIYLKKGWIKVEIGLGKGKKMYDKRETMKRRDALRDVEQAMKTMWLMNTTVESNRDSSADSKEL